MTGNDRKKYIEEIFKLCKTDSILIINNLGKLERLPCSFVVIAIMDLPQLAEGDVVMVTAVRMSLELIDVYIVRTKAYYLYNFILSLDA
jgi:hypothetical protein